MSAEPELVIPPRPRGRPEPEAIPPRPRTGHTTARRPDLVPEVRYGCPFCRCDPLPSEGGTTFSAIRRLAEHWEELHPFELALWEISLYGRVQARPGVAMAEELP